MPEHPGTLDVPDPDRFTILKAAEGGSLPEEVERGLTKLSEAVTPALGQDPAGVVGMRFGRRIIVAPVGQPENAVDIADVDMTRKVILTVGGKDPGPSGSLLAQVLFNRQDAVVGYARAEEIPGPTLDAMKSVLVPLQRAPVAQAQGVGTVAVGMQAGEVGNALHGLAEDETNQADESQGGADDKPDPGINQI